MYAARLITQRNTTVTGLASSGAFNQGKNLVAMALYSCYTLLARN